MVKTALVTGAYGFIGRHAARQLAYDGWRVIGLGHGSWSRPDWQCWGIAEWHFADVTLENLITYGQTPELIIHCAGSGSVGFSLVNPYQDFQRTVATTLAVMEYARIFTPEAKIAYPSSAGVYGIVQKLPITESDALSPVSPYGIHKCLAESICKSYASNFGVSVAVVRLFSVYGVGLRKQLLWDASQKIINGVNGYSGTGQEIRDWLHVEDAASLLITAAEHASATCPTVNGGSGVGISVQEVVTRLFALFGCDDVPNFSGIARKGDPPGYVADVSMIKQWGWNEKMNCRDGFREYVDWVKRGAP